jgi:hypothetical protein
LENKKLVIMVILLGDVFVIMVIPPWWFSVIPGDHWSPNQKPPDFQKGVSLDSAFDIFHDIFHGDSTYPIIIIRGMWFHVCVYSPKFKRDWWFTGNNN